MTGGQREALEGRAALRAGGGRSRPRRRHEQRRPAAAAASRTSRCAISSTPSTCSSPRSCASKSAIARVRDEAGATPEVERLLAVPRDVRNGASAASRCPTMPAATVGLVAGAGRLPFEVARGARRAGRRVVAVAFDGFADPALAAEVDALHWVRLGELGALFGALRDAGAREAVVAGNVPKEHLFARLRPDPPRRARRRVPRGAARPQRRRDPARRSATRSKPRACTCCRRRRYAEHLLAPAGALGGVAPTRRAARRRRLRRGRSPRRSAGSTSARRWS